VRTQLDRLAIESPDRRVVIITFNNEVVIWGTEAHSDITIAGDRLDQFDELFEMGRTGIRWESVPPISESCAALKEKVDALSEGGATAMGPALSVCLGIASSHRKSEIVLCTDGAPNVGVGSLEAESKPKSKAAASMSGESKGTQFYRMVGERAKENESIISIISIQGADCGLEQLSMCAEATSGTSNILVPLELVREIRKIGQRKVVATDVEATIFVHPHLALAPSISASGASKATLTIGNVTNESDMSISYAVRPEFRSSLAGSIPFQLQIRYTRPDGSRCIRIVSATKHVTADRTEAEKACNAAIVGMAAIQRAAALAQEQRDFKAARELIHATRHMLRRGAVSDEQQEELGNFVTQSDDMDAELRALEQRSSSSSTSSSSGGARSQAPPSLDDHSAQLLGSKKKANRNQFLAASKKTVVDKRKGDKRLNEAYYNFQFE